ncbi:MAG: hypothetical protein MHM6MM_006431 [Cercozoa sp. M6MM]
MYCALAAVAEVTVNKTDVKILVMLNGKMSMPNETFGDTFDVKGITANALTVPTSKQDKPPAELMQRETELARFLRQDTVAEIDVSNLVLPSMLAMSPASASSTAPDVPALPDNLAEIFRNDTTFLREQLYSTDYSMLLVFRAAQLRRKGGDTGLELRPALCRAAIIDYLWVTGVGEALGQVTPFQSIPLTPPGYGNRLEDFITASRLLPQYI